MLRSLNGPFDLMQLLPAGIRISQHVGELSNENCRIAARALACSETLGLIFKCNNAFHFS